MRRLLLVLCLTAAAGAARDARAGATCTVVSTDMPSGLTYKTCTDSSIPARIYLVEVDLTNAAIELFATPQEQRGKTTSAYAATVGPAPGAALAINGDSFAIADYTPTGLAIGSGVPWSNTADDATSAVFYFQRGVSTTSAGIAPPEDLTTPDGLPAGTEGAISGRPLLVRAGQVVSDFDCNDPVTLACERAPRSAIGLSADGTKLYVVAVDGWQSGSAGMKASELAAFMKARGAATAMALDGGSSSTLYWNGGLVNHPSDGVERNVANQLAIRSGTLPPGEMLGLVCKNTVTNCSTDSTLHISGATVTLDTGSAETTDATATFDFANITPRLACITVKKTGYLTKRQCREVPSNGQVYNSVALVPGTDPTVDAGVPDAPPAAGDAAMPGADGGTGGDAGNPAMGGGGGCCDAGGDRPEVLVVVLVAWFLMRRRVTLA